MKNAIEVAFSSLCLERHGDTKIAWSGNADNYDSLDKVKRTDGETLKFTWDEVLIKKTELVAEYDAQEYARNRDAEYPAVKDQLDYMFHNGFDKWKEDIVQPVKDKYPKPE